MTDGSELPGVNPMQCINVETSITESGRPIYFSRKTVYSVKGIDYYYASL